MSAWSFYTVADLLIGSPSKPPVYGLEGGREKNVVSGYTLGRQVRSEIRGPDQRILSLEWKRVTPADLSLLDAICGAYGGNAASFRVELPDGALAGVVGGAKPRFRCPDTRARHRWVAYQRYDVSLSLIEDLAGLDISGSLTQVNTRLSIVPGTAFGDLVGVDLSPYAPGARYLVLTDAAGRRLAGWLKAAGTGETFGAEIITNGGFDSNTTGWVAEGGTLASVAGGQTGNCLEITKVSGPPQFAYQDVNASMVSGRCYRLAAWLKSGTSGNEAAYLILYDAIQSQFVNPTSSGTWTVQSLRYTRRAGASSANVQLVKNTATAGTMLFDSVSLQQVLTPSATGATIVSTRGGSTYNWAIEEAGFERNDQNGYRYAVYSY